VHVRNEAAGVLQAVNEMVDVARRSGAPLHLSHLKVVGNRELVGPLLDLVGTAMADVDLTFDQYPYGAGTSMLAQILPPWAQDGGPTAILGRLGDAAERRAIARDVARGLPGWENLYGNLGPDSFVIARAGPPREGDTGKTLARLGDERGADPLGAALELLLDTKLDVTTIEHYAEEETVREIFQHPLALVGSDAIFSTRPHPRLHGTAARVLGRYALREGLIPVQDAVARLTSRPAGRLGLRDRGAIREGLRADLVLVDPDRFVDAATYDDPIRYPEGVVRVVVGGRTVWDQHGPTGETPGGVVTRRPG
jgi:N-acyl-D-amino-acid deacylase